MAKKSLQSVLYSFFFFFISFSAISVSAQVCLTSTENFKPNSPYENNRRLILSTLASNVTAHDGYFNGSFGLGPDRVYAMGMCSSYSDADVCSYCIQTASRSLLKTCLEQTDAYAWQDEEILCLVRYSSKFFSGVLALEPKEVNNNYLDIKEEDLKEFDSVWDGLMSRMITRVSSSSSSSLLSSSKYYAMDMDVTPFPDYKDISALMQCTPDITPSECKLCLQRSVDLYKSTQYHGKRGFMAVRPSCFFRWELFNFSGAFDGIHPVDLTSPSPSKTQFVASLTSKNKKDARLSRGNIALIVIVIFVFITSIAIGIAVFKRRKQRQKILPTESVQFDLKTIAAATSNFSECKKLGEGGFGEVYKGMLMDGTKVAVKRLSKASEQGEIEFENEVVVVAKLQHRNLVRLLGFSLQGEEKLLIYEYVPNKSLDYFLFDPNKITQLSWTMRRNIIGGITRGLLYLHQDSRLKIIHRDLKAGNILLDSNMNPKIADFGVARIFEIDQTVANTSRVVGTFGYMSPEYVTHGQISTKSDVYSFGVLVLEIISGKKTSSFYQMDGLVNNLVTYVWRLWENKSLPELIDPGIREDCKSDEFTRYIHIGLLCVQENPSVRPAMSTIHQWLTTSSIALPVPLAPGFFFTNGPGSIEPGQWSSKAFTCSVDEATITEVTPR